MRMRGAPHAQFMTEAFMTIAFLEENLCPC
jgi:hypothetical protein